MGKLYEAISAEHAAWIAQQHVFFVATAPAGSGGHVNVSPKGLDCLRVLDERTVAYLDLTGSGAETIAHVRQNGRITVMFCAFEGRPRVLRLYGEGSVHPVGTEAFDAMAAGFPSLASARCIVHVAVQRVASSCGYGVPLMEFTGERDDIAGWAERKGADGIEAYWRDRNAASIDGLPALD